jgi:hypothetical protein
VHLCVAGLRNKWVGFNPATVATYAASIESQVRLWLESPAAASSATPVASQGADADTGHLGEDQYLVEKLMAERIVSGRRQFLVRLIEGSIRRASGCTRSFLCCRHRMV